MEKFYAVNIYKGEITLQGRMLNNEIETIEKCLTIGWHQGGKQIKQVGVYVDKTCSENKDTVFTSYFYEIENTQLEVTFTEYRQRTKE